METRIREFRKLRGLTLKELAERISTTPQTVQRLETANMTVSTDWLEKIAGALNIEPADLIARPGGREIPVIGRVINEGRVRAGEGKQVNTLHLHVPADDPVAAQPTGFRKPTTKKPMPPTVSSRWKAEKPCSAA